MSLLMASTFRSRPSIVSITYSIRPNSNSRRLHPNFATAACHAKQCPSNVTISTTKPSIPPSVYDQLESQFRSRLGPNSVDRLKQLESSPQPIILLAGDQCTGKSTLAKRLATHLNGRHFAAGDFFRAKAKQLGISNAELSRRALSDPSIDVGIEYSLCELICSGDPSKPLVIEGRQPVVIENFLRTKIGKRATFRLRLTCSVQQQAARFIEREYGLEHANSIMAQLPQRVTKLSQLTPSLRALKRADLEKIIRAFNDNDTRDEDDKRRFEEFYGVSPFLDHTNTTLYDAILDTTKNKSEDTFQQALAILQCFITPPTAAAPAKDEQILRAKL